MTESSFDNLRTLHAATTPGEWSVRAADSPREASILDERENALIWAGDYASSEATLPSADAAFIVAAHNELPALLARLDEVTAEREALAAVIEKAMSVAARENDVVLYRILSTAPSSVLAAHDAKVRAEALREAADDYRQQALPVNSELSMLGGAGPFVDKGIEGYMEAQHDAWDWLRARADEEENR